MAPLSAPGVGPAVGPEHLARVRRQRHAQPHEHATHSSGRRGRWRRRSGGVLGRPLGQREGPEQRGSDPPFRGGPRPSACRRCVGPGGRSPSPGSKQGIARRHGPNSSLPRYRGPIRCGRPTQRDVPRQLAKSAMRCGARGVSKRCRRSKSSATRAARRAAGAGERVGRRCAVRGRRGVPTCGVRPQSAEMKPWRSA
jgi:hypothetical protein